MIFLVSDIHTSQKRLDTHILNVESSIGRNLDSRDTLVCLGDLFGLPASKAPSLADKLSADKKLISYIETLPFNVLCIYGNHDDAKRMYKLGAQDAWLWEQHVRQVASNIFYLDDGQVYDIPLNAEIPEGESVSVLALGGSFGHMYRFNGAPVEKEIAFYKKYLPLMCAVEPIEVDYVLAHDAPTSRLGRFVRTVFGPTPATNVLDAVEDNLVFSEWYFGHHHFDLEPHPHFHCLYRREKELTLPSPASPKFNEKLLHLEDDGDDGYDKKDGPMTLTEMMIAMSSASNVEDRMVSGQVPVPHVPTDAEIELLVACMKEDAKEAKNRREVSENEVIDADGMLRDDLKESDD